MFQPTVYDPAFVSREDIQHFRADAFPDVRPIHWLHSHFAVGGWSPLQRLSGMITAHMTEIAPRNGFTWHPHRGLEIYTWVLEGTLYHEDTTGGRGDIHAGEFQRMFSGDWIEHQELNRTEAPARVIQIWFAADAQYRHLPPHYQQVGEAALPARRQYGATIYDLIDGESPMDSHVNARLTATVITPGGSVELEPPRAGEDLFLYVTDGSGALQNSRLNANLGQYDVVLARPDAHAHMTAGQDAPLHYLSFYLPSFL
ncbi:MAG: pirin family protein [Anaerolineae bacterium]|nr:pirin family protein [Anaerolineae bacterium]